MQSDSGADARQRVHLPGITELFFNGGSCSGLDEFAKASSGIGKTPGRDLNPELIQSTCDFVCVYLVHRDTFLAAVRYGGYIIGAVPGEANVREIRQVCVMRAAYRVSPQWCG